MKIERKLIEINGTIGLAKHDIVICALFDDGERYFFHDDSGLNWSFKKPEGYVEVCECDLTIEHDEFGNAHGIAYTGWMD